MLLNNLFFLLSLNSIDGSPTVKKPISLISLSRLDKSIKEIGYFAIGEPSIRFIDNKNDELLKKAPFKHF